MHKLIILSFVCICVVGCSTTPSRYKLKDDVEPSGAFDVSGVPLLTPVWEPLSRQGNASPYTVRGKQYEVLSSNAPYDVTGYASWYGLKFHGELTSNGEIYDMYSFSAAHKSLPLPSYVRVSNLENGASLIVRVNDRGPFHSDRIIDLSYAAAIKLGFKDKGTAKVRVERLFTPKPAAVSGGVASSAAEVASSEAKVDRLAPFIQVAAFSTHDVAEATKERIAHVLPSAKAFVAVAPNTTTPLYRVRIGPFESNQLAKEMLKVLKREGIGAPQIITRSVNAPDR